MRTLLLTLLACCFAAPAAAAPAYASGGKLRLTRGVTTVEGTSGGGLATWALIAGDETRDGLGATANATVVRTGDFQLHTYGAAVGAWNRVELSYQRQAFDTLDAGAALGLGEGFTFGQDIYGAKLRLAGDAVYDQDRWLPQLAVGVQHKRADKGAIIRAVGGVRDSDTDVYVSATKLYLAQSLLLSGAVRFTRANQFGLLGYGGDKGDDHTTQFEGSVGWLATRHLLVGAEVRTKPDRLGFAREQAAWDAYAAWSITRRLTLTAAYVDLGDIATFRDQRGLYLSLQAGF